MRHLREAEAAAAVILDRVPPGNEAFDLRHDAALRRRRFGALAGGFAAGRLAGVALLGVALLGLGLLGERVLGSFRAFRVLAAQAEIISIGAQMNTEE